MLIQYKCKCGSNNTIDTSDTYFKSVKSNFYTDLKLYIYFCACNRKYEFETFKDFNCLVTKSISLPNN